MVIEYQNNLDDFREMSNAIVAARRPVNSPMQIVILAMVFGAYYVLTRFLWKLAGDVDGQLAWLNMWIAMIALGAMWLAMSLPASFRARRFPWLTGRQWVSVSSFVVLIASLVFQHWMNHKFNPNARVTKLTWQVLLPHSIWLLILVYSGSVAGFNYSTAFQRRWNKRPDLHRHQTVDISASGVVFSDTAARHEFQWSAFVKGEETRNLFLLFTAEPIAWIIPKRAYSGAEELDAMRNLIKLIPKSEMRGFVVESAGGARAVVSSSKAA